MFDVYNHIINNLDSKSRLDCTLNLDYSIARWLDLEEQIAAWQYQPFGKAKYTRCNYAVMPWLATVTIALGYLPDYSHFVTAMQKKDVSKKHCFQFWAGWLREYHVGLYFATLGYNVTKNIDEDLNCGIDWRINGFPVAVKHKGEATNRHWQQRKLEKLEDNVIVLTAEGEQDTLHLVPSAQLADVVIQLS